MKGGHAVRGIQDGRKSRAARHAPQCRTGAGCRILLALTLASALQACRETRPAYRLGGHTMGTTWHATIVASRHAGPDAAALQNLLQARLDEIDLALSHWRDSPLTRFNAIRSTDWQPVPLELAEVVEASLSLSRLTHGALDITIAPLVNLWGFGPHGRVVAPPEQAAISRLLDRVGWRHLKARTDPPALRKDVPEVEINVAALANGYAADDLARRLTSLGFRDFLLEIGGAVVARGRDEHGAIWRIAIQRPDGARAGGLVSLPLSDAALSTSGTYRQFFDHLGRRHAHVLDARTGRPIQHKVVSVSVAHESALAADGWDTALLILGSAEGRRLAAEHRLDAVFLEAP